jgi:hypothetical protein
VPIAFDLAAIKERHARRVADYARWKADVVPEEYADIDALIAHIDRALAVVSPADAALDAENRALRTRLEALETETAWFRLDHMNRRGG